MENMKQLQDAVKQEDWNGALEIIGKTETGTAEMLGRFLCVGDDQLTVPAI